MSRVAEQLRTIIRAMVAITLALASVALARPAVAGEAQPISGPNPTCELALEYEPQVAVNPTDPDNIVAAWIEGNAQAIVVGVSKDGGQSWTQVLVPELVGCSGVLREDPRLAFANDGKTLFLASLCFASCAEDPGTDLVIVRRSFDGGLTWEGKASIVARALGCPQIPNPNCYNGEVSITAHPTDANAAYVIWTQHDIVNNLHSTYFSRTSNGGGSWTAPQRIQLLSGLSILHDIRVLPDGSLLDVFVDYSNFEATQKAMRSTDDGVTWSTPVAIGAVPDIKATDAETGNVYQGAVKPAFDVAPDGTVYVAWQDIRSTTSSTIHIAKSNNKKRTNWTELSPVKPASDYQAFQPMLAVGPAGTIGVTYYDFRYDQPGDDELTTAVWFTHSYDGGITWEEETLLAGPFDLRISVVLGEVDGLAATPDGFAATFVQAGDAVPEPPQDIYFAPIAVP